MTEKKEEIQDVECIRDFGKIVANGYYDYQDTRLSSMNRIRDIIRRKLEGISTKKPEDKKEEKTYGKEYQDANIAALIEKMFAEKVIDEEEHDYILSTLELFDESVKMETRYKKLMLAFVEREPIWIKFLKDMKGISGVFGANLISEFGYCDKRYDEDVFEKGTENIIHKKGDERCPHVSSLWRLVGYHVKDGKAPKKKRGELTDYNPKLRTLCWKVSDSFVKQRTPVYRDIYDTEKEKQTNIMETTLCKHCGKKSYEHKYDKGKKAHVCKKGDTLFETELSNPPMCKMHVDLRARRKMMKIFLQHYWLTARKIKGLPVSEPYSIGKLGHTHYIKP